MILNVVDNQWAISSFQGIAGGDEAPFAARAIGYGLPACVSMANDFPAVYAVTQWAAHRARANLGATLIEHVTYRAEGHSTSDDPMRYRAADEGTKWPLGEFNSFVAAWEVKSTISLPLRVRPSMRK